jgi:hypothetical protein
VNAHLALLEKERIATYCVCCGSTDLQKSPAILMPFVAHRVFDWQPVEITDDWGLKTIKNGMAYPLCNSLQCNNCQLLFLDIRFTESEINKLYNRYREADYVTLRENYEPGYQKRNDLLNAGIDYLADIERFLTPHLTLPLAMLDWGGDTGKNTPFKNQASVFHVYDISHKPVIAEAKSIDKLIAKNTHYDLIICSNVLEHIPYPAEVILEIRQYMSQNTVLYIEVPCEEIIKTANTTSDLSQKKKHWHEHINFYTEQSLIELLTQTGFAILELRLLEKSSGDAVYMLACQLTLG